MRVDFTTTGSFSMNAMGSNRSTQGWKRHLALGAVLLAAGVCLSAPAAWASASATSAAEAGRILRRVEAGELIAPAEARLWAESFDRLWQDMAKGHHTIKSLLDRARPRLTPPDDVV
jgi:hypothetical protein